MLRLTLLVAVLLTSFCSGRVHAYLHPQLGRFLQRDPAGYVDGMVLYGYLRSSPANGIDPEGLYVRDPSKEADGMTPTLEFDRDNRQDPKKCPCPCSAAKKNCSIGVHFVDGQGEFIRIRRTSVNSGERTYTDMVVNPESKQYASQLLAVEIVSNDGSDIRGCTLSAYRTDRWVESEVETRDLGLKEERDYPATGANSSTAVLYGGFYFVDQPTLAIGGTGPLAVKGTIIRRGFWQSRAEIDGTDIKVFYGFQVDRTGAAATRRSAVPSTGPSGQIHFGPGERHKNPFL